jgi:putative ABC transport system permease protein
MITRPFLLKLFRDLWQRIGTITALVLILAVGVSSYISMAGVYHDLNNARANYYHRYNLASFMIDLESAPETAITPLTHLPNILRLRTRIRTPVMVNLPQKSYHKIPHPIPGEALSLPTTPKNIINNIKLYKGSWFSSPYAREVIIDEQFANARHLVPGDRIKVLLPDQEYDLLIIGTALSPEFVMVLPPGGVISPEPQNYAPIYFPRKFLQQSTNLNNSFNQLLGISSDNSPIALQNTMQLLSDKLDAYGVQLQTAIHDQISAKILHDELNHLQAVTTIFPTMFLLIAALVLNVIMSRLVTQQRGTIGILKALGYSNISLIFHYLLYGIMIGALGGLLGIGTGIWLQEGMLYMYRTYFAIPHLVLHIYPKTFLIGMSISIISALLGTLWGAWQAAKLQPADAMRPPMPEKGMNIFLERLTHYWIHLSFQHKMVMRAIFRNRVRSIVTVSASILATALVFSSLSFLDSMNKMVEFTFDLVQHQDFELTLRDPVGKEIIQTVSTLQGVKSVETKLSVPVEMKNGPYLKRLAIVGIPTNNKMFTPVDQYDQRIQITSTGLVLTEALAKMLNANINDYIQIKPLIGDQKKVNVLIKKIVPSYIGFSAYADQTWLSHLLGNSWVTNNILFQLYPNTNLHTFIKAVNRFAPMINLVNQKDSKEALLETLNRFIAFSLLIMIMFAGIIAVGSIINTAIISLSERERDVASLRVLGFTTFQVAQIFFTESATLNAVGIILGLVLGIYFTYWMSAAFSTEVFSMPVVITPMRLTESAFIMCSFVLISQMIIYRIIKKLNWFDVLNNRE